MTRDGRTLDHGTLETIRTMAVERVRPLRRSSLHALSLAHGGTWAWPRTPRARGAPRDRPPTDPDRAAGTTGVSLDQGETSAAIRVRGWFVDASDRARTDGAAIRRAVESGLDGALLVRQGLTSQKPLPRAYQRDPDAIDRWQRETYPTIAHQAKRTHAEISFWDESGFRADAVHGTT